MPLIKFVSYIFVSLLFYQNGRRHFHLQNSIWWCELSPNGPVMQKKTLKWEPSTEKMYVRDGVLTGDVNMALLLKENAHYRCDFRTSYK